MALCIVANYVAFAYGKINIPISAGGSTAIHIANAVVVLSAWILGPVYGGFAGAVGLSIADVLDPRYITSAPKTFIMKFMIGFIAGVVADWSTRYSVICINVSFCRYLLRQRA